MAELKYVVKCFLFSILILVTLQVKVKDRTIEFYGTQWLYESRLGMYMQNVGEGGALLVQDLYTKLRAKFNDATGNTVPPPRSRTR